ncbi:hypothetical protein IOK49_02645 [Fervidicoccus fontis]|uniref:Uncharacterized protein n=1 Tax=Fervidicoccus fontis TaxID=683846 RepID=A0A843ACZ5_9CREN|nr:hypothetical protein [Fervidicoccus fontis]MBE9390977.1 hypothetical protein [Fervidicoccus fontis]
MKEEEETKKILQEMKEDHIHGASWYYEKMVEVFKKAGFFDKKLANELIKIRPGMASIQNVIESLEKAEEKRNRF